MLPTSVRRFLSGPIPWHLVAAALGLPVFAVGVLAWGVACARIALRGRPIGLGMFLLPLLLLVFDGLGVWATLWTVRRKIWTIAGPYMALPVTSWSALGWGLIAAGQGLFLTLGSVGLWRLAPARVDVD